MKLSCINFIHTNKQPVSQGSDGDFSDCKIIDIGTVSPNQHYEIDNPYPGYYVYCLPEICVDGKWGYSGFATYVSNMIRSYGVTAYQFNDNKITITTGTVSCYHENTNWTGAPFRRNSSVTVFPNCRVKIWRIGKF